MKAKKSNKSYTIEEREATKFQGKGFDIYTDESFPYSVICFLSDV